MMFCEYFCIQFCYYSTLLYNKVFCGCGDDGPTTDFVKLFFLKIVNLSVVIENIIIPKLALVSMSVCVICLEISTLV